jgi:Transcription factor WhiB.
LSYSEELQWSLNGTEPCKLPYDSEGNPNDPDKWVGSWVNSTTPEVAEELCFGCHVKDLCLKAALENNEKDFIWGGTTPEQRKEMLDARRRGAKKANTRSSKDKKEEGQAA